MAFTVSEILHYRQEINKLKVSVLISEVLCSCDELLLRIIIITVPFSWRVLLSNTLHYWRLYQGVILWYDDILLLHFSSLRSPDPCETPAITVEMTRISWNDTTMLWHTYNNSSLTCIDGGVLLPHAAPLLCKVLKWVGELCTIPTFHSLILEYSQSILRRTNVTFQTRTYRIFY